MTLPPLRTAALVGALAAFLALFWDVWSSLIRDWTTDDNYSHGFLIVPVAAYLAWERRARLAALPVRPALTGFVVIVGSLGVLLVGRLGAELFLTRIAIIGSVAGGILFVLGWQHLRVLAFPVAFLLLMVPIPAILFNQVALPLQLLASRVGETTLRLFEVPVLREGNVIHLARTTLEVAEACSGIRSLISLVTLGIVYGYFADARVTVRWVLVLATIPIAIVTNASRVAGTGLAAHYYGEEAAQGFFHDFSGWVVFLAAFALMFIALKVIVRVFPSRLPARGLQAPGVTT
jgi:exosortase